MHDATQSGQAWSQRAESELGRAVDALAGGDVARADPELAVHVRGADAALWASLMVGPPRAVDSVRRPCSPRRGGDE